jgi:tetratricopeptide (TPR) repeat protein
MRSTAAVLLHLFLAPLMLAASPRITFERVLPAAHDLGRVQDVAIVSAPANNPLLELFIERFTEETNRFGFLRVRDARTTTGPGDLHLDIKTFTCDTAERQGEGSVRDLDGERVKRTYVTVGAVCMARIDVLSRFMKRQSTFYAKGEGSSPHVAAVTEEERKDALEHAARHAADDAAERITPRRIRESIALDETAPAFADAYSLIDADQPAEARKIWERELRKQPRSAALHYNLGAVCEALGDRHAAELHYVAARQLAPQEQRYTSEFKLFAKRGPTVGPGH